MNTKLWILLIITAFTLGMKSTEPKVQWLNSVVTEHWTKEKDGCWRTTSPSVYGQVSSPFAVIGLREDGVVVWKSVEE